MDIKKDLDPGGTRIEGRNAVVEAIKAGRTLDKVYIASGDTDRTLKWIASLAKDAGAVISLCDKRKLDAMSVTGAHQGVIASAAARTYATLDEVFVRAGKDPPLIVLCDGITDPHNLGAIIRTAEAAGAHGVVVPKHRSVGLTAVVDKTSAGALEHLPVVRVTNLAACVQELKQRGVWIFGTAMQADSVLYDADFKRPCAIVIGAEGEGMSHILRRACDYTVSIPMLGKIESLNASAAAAVLLYEAVRQRRATGK